MMLMFLVQWRIPIYFLCVVLNNTKTITHKNTRIYAVLLM
jgi:hypothetical protein